MSNPWQPIATAPHCVGNGERVPGDNGRRPVLVTYAPVQPHAQPPIAVARLTVKGWISGKTGTRLWFRPTHWMPLPDERPEPVRSEATIAAADDGNGTTP